MRLNITVVIIFMIISCKSKLFQENIDKDVLILNTVLKEIYTASGQENINFFTRPVNDLNPEYINYMLSEGFLQTPRNCDESILKNLLKNTEEKENFLKQTTNNELISFRKELINENYSVDYELKDSTYIKKYQEELKNATTEDQKSMLAAYYWMKENDTQASVSASRVIYSISGRSAIIGTRSVVKGAFSGGAVWFLHKENDSWIIDCYENTYVH